MLRWLNRSPESFLPGFSASANTEAGFPNVGQHQVLRFNTRQIYEALDTQRKERNLTWTQVGKELGLSASSLRHLEKGGRTSFPSVMRIMGWLGCPAAEFTHAVGGAH